MERGLGDEDFKRDAWNTPYVYAGTLIRSVGSGTNIDKLVAPGSAELLANTVRGWVRDADRQPPGVNADSITVLLGFPDGSGVITYATAGVDRHGRFTFSGVPIGNHGLWVVYAPDADTITMAVAVYPGRDASLDVCFPADLW
jgi:hypothetical protein